MADNATLARSFYEAFNNRDFDLLADSGTPDAKVIVVGTGDVFEGPEGSRLYNQTWVDGFPDGKATVDNVIADGDRVVVELTGRGTHTGTLMTSMGPIPATGHSVTLKLCDVLEFKDGKLAVQRTYFDSGSMMAQLGLMPQQAATSKQ